MTHDEMIAVIQAHKEGKTIQSKLKDKTYNNDWDDCSSDICWDFSEVDYRIKPKPHYRPFKNAEEVMAAIKEHGNYIKDHNTYRIFKKFTIMENGEIFYSFSGMKDREYREIPLHFTFADGTPFGVMEE